MQLRGSITAPERYGDADFGIPKPKKPPSTVPFYPDLLAEQRVPFDEQAKPAAFPSLPLHRSARPTQQEVAAPAARQPLPTGEDEDSDIGDDDSTDDEYPQANSAISINAAIGARPHLRWDSLELPIQYVIWINLCNWAPEDAAARMLELSPEEIFDIRAAAERRLQVPFTSDFLLQGLRSNGHDDDTLMELNSKILHVQKYELAFLEEIEQGWAFLRQRRLHFALLGEWNPDPEGSNFMKARPDIPTNGVRSGNSAVVDSRYSSPTKESQNAQIQPTNLPAQFQPIQMSRATTAAQKRIEEANGQATAAIPRYKTAAEYHNDVQARAARLRKAQARLQSTGHVIPQQGDHEGPNQSITQVPAPAFSHNAQPLSTTWQLPPPLAPYHRPSPLPHKAPASVQIRKPIVLKTGIDPQQHVTSTITVASPYQPEETLNTPAGTLRAGLVQSYTPRPVVTATTRNQSSGERSAGSMSLRRRDALKDSQALAAQRQNQDFWDEGYDDVSETEEAVAQATPKKVVSLKIDNKTALANIFQLDPHSRPDHYRADHLKLTTPTSNTNLHPSTSAAAQTSKSRQPLQDDETLFAKWISCCIVPSFETKLRARPIDERNLVEMWLLYGSNTWHPSSPWNANMVSHKFTPPDAGTQLNIGHANSGLAKVLVQEWNRFQHMGIGQDVLEKTDIAIWLVDFCNKSWKAKNVLARVCALQAPGQDNQHLVRQYEQHIWTMRMTLFDQVRLVYARRFEYLNNMVMASRLLNANTAGVLLDNSIRDTKPNQQAIPQLPMPNQRAPFSNKAPGPDFVTKLIEHEEAPQKVPSSPAEHELGAFADDAAGAATNANIPATKMEFELGNMAYNTRPKLAVSARDFGTPSHRSNTDTPTSAVGDIAQAFKAVAATDHILPPREPRTVDKSALPVTMPNIEAQTPRRKQAKSPKRPSWSPIDDAKDFQVPSTPLTKAWGLPPTTLSLVEDDPPDMNTFLGDSYLEKATAHNEVSSEPDAQVHGKTTSTSNGEHTTELVSVIEPFTAPVEAYGVDSPSKQHKGHTTTPKLTLTIKKPTTVTSVEVNDAVSPTESKTFAESEDSRALASQEPAPTSEVSARVTRSVTGTPAPQQAVLKVEISDRVTRSMTGTPAPREGEMPPPALAASTIKRKDTPRSRAASIKNATITKEDTPKATYQEAEGVVAPSGEKAQAKTKSVGGRKSESAVNDLAKAAFPNGTVTPTKTVPRKDDATGKSTEKKSGTKQKALRSFASYKYGPQKKTLENCDPETRAAWEAYKVSRAGQANGSDVEMAG